MAAVREDERCIEGKGRDREQMGDLACTNERRRKEGREEGKEKDQSE